MQEKKVGRNEKCPCGSDKKYKKCCLVKQQEQIKRNQEIERQVYEFTKASEKETETKDVVSDSSI